MADKGEVLAAAAGLAAGERGHIHRFLAQQLGHIGQGIARQRGVHHHAGAVIAELHLGGAAVGGGYALCNLGHALMDKGTDLLLRVHSADGAPHIGRIRDDVGGLACLEPAGSEHAEACGVQLAAVDLLQGNVDVRRCGDGVDAGVGHRAVATLAVHNDVVLLAAGHGDAAARHQHHPSGQGHPGQYMEHDGCVYLGVLQQAAVDHIQRALKDLFCGLELQLYRALDLVLVLLEQLGRAQHHGGVHIVAAAVHLAGQLRGKLLAGFLLQGQRVHVAPQQDHLAGTLAACKRHHAALAAILRGVAHLGQRLFDQCLGLGQVEAHLRVTEQCAPPFLQLGLQLLCSFQQLFRCDHSKSAPFHFIESLPDPCQRQEPGGFSA